MPELIIALWFSYYFIGFGVWFFLRFSGLATMTTKMNGKVIESPTLRESFRILCVCVVFWPWIVWNGRVEL